MKNRSGALVRLHLGSVKTHGASSPAVRKPTAHLIGRIYRNFATYLKPYRLRIVLAYASLVGTVAMKVLEPWPLKLIFDHILCNKPLPAMLAFVTLIPRTYLAP